MTLLVLAIGAPVTAADRDAEDRAAQANGLSIADAGTDRNGNRTFTIQADRVEIGEVLRALLRKSDAEVAIDQDVSGPITLSLRAVPLLDALQWTVQLARPRIKIVKSGGVYHVMRDPAAQQRADALLRQYQTLTGNAATAWPAVVTNDSIPRPHPLGSAIQVNAVPSRYVSLDIPVDHPIPLADALSRISAQTRFAILVDSRVPRELTFTGTITQAPLSLVLSEIAETSGLRVVATSTMATFLPTDEFTLLVNDTLLGQFPGAPCPHCGAWVSAAWNYCPNCGQITPRGVRLSLPPGAGGKSQPPKPE